MLVTRSSSGSRLSGFTLLEIILALAVSAVVMIAIQTVFFGALRLRNTTAAELERNLALERALSFVHQDISGLMLPGGVLAGTFQTTPTSSLADDSIGDRVSPDIYTNTGTVDGWNPFGDVQMVTYYLVSSSDGSNNKTLVRAVTRNLLPVQDTAPDVQALLPGVTQANFSYYDGTEWTDTWDSTATSTLPTAIKFSLQLASNDPAQQSQDPIEIVVPVLVMTTTSASQNASSTSP